jgi:hypothetical protein
VHRTRPRTGKPDFWNRLLIDEDHGLNEKTGSPQRVGRPAARNRIAYH